jgi:C4-dicarboxylate transporter DctM subunit
MILIIVCGAMIFGNAITQMGVPGAINDFFLSHNMPSQIFLLIIMVIVIIMGCFLDGASIMLLWFRSSRLHCHLQDGSVGIRHSSGD